MTKQSATNSTHILCDKLDTRVPRASYISLAIIYTNYDDGQRNIHKRSYDTSHAPYNHLN